MSQYYISKAPGIVPAGGFIVLFANETCQSRLNDAPYGVYKTCFMFTDVRVLGSARGGGEGGGVEGSQISLYSSF